MTRVVKKRPYVLQKAAAGEWLAADDKEYESRAEAETALKALGAVGTYRICRVCAVLNVAVSQLTKISMTEV